METLMKIEKKIEVCPLSKEMYLMKSVNFIKILKIIVKSDNFRYNFESVECKQIFAKIPGDFSFLHLATLSLTRMRKIKPISLMANLLIF